MPKTNKQTKLEKNAKQRKKKKTKQNQKKNSVYAAAI